jgi:hypothetical protein
MPQTRDARAIDAMPWLAHVGKTKSDRMAQKERSRAANAK